MSTRPEAAAAARRAWRMPDVAAIAEHDRAAVRARAAQIAPPAPAPLQLEQQLRAQERRGKGGGKSKYQDQGSPCSG